MNKSHRPLSTLSLVSAFLMGAIFFLSIGQNWLDLESISIFLAGLIGVVFAVFAFRMLKIRNNSDHEE